MPAYDTIFLEPIIQTNSALQMLCGTAISYFRDFLSLVEAVTKGTTNDELE
jgi:hypothetical protein